MNKINNKIAAVIIMVAAILFVNPAASAQSVLDQIIKKASLLDKNAEKALSSGNKEEAMRISEEEREVLTPNGLIADYILYGNTMHRLATLHAYQKEWEEAISNESAAIENFKKMKVEADNIAALYNNLSTFYFKKGEPGDFETAIQYAEEALKNAKNGSDAYFKTTTNLIVYYSQTGNTGKAKALNARIVKNAKSMRKSKDAASRLRYAESLDAQSVCLARSGDYTNAIVLIEECKNIYTEQHADSTSEYARLLMNAANIYSHKENYTNVIELLEQAKGLLAFIEGTSSTNYIKCISDLASAYNKTGDLEKANDYLTDLRTSVSSLGSSGSLSEAHAIMKQASVIAGGGDYKSAIDMTKAAIDIASRYKDTLAIAGMKNILSVYYNDAGDHDNAISTCEEIVGIYANMEGHQTDEALAIGNMARYYYTAKDFDKAIEYGKASIDKYAEANDTMSSFYAKALNNYAIYRQAHGDLQQSIDYAGQAYSIQSAVLGERHPDNVVSLFNMAYFYDINKQTDTMQLYYSKALRLQTEHIKRNFSHLSTTGREIYWNTKNNIFNVAPIYAYIHHDNDSLLRDAYNASLLTKGLLLNSEIDFRKTLINSGNMELLEKYNRLGEMIKHQESLTGKEDYDAEAEAIQIVRLEREIMRESKLFGDFTGNMSITVDKLAASLRDDEAAVEMFDLKTSNGHAYFALVMRRGWQCPRYAFMFNDFDLDNIVNNETNDKTSFRQMLTQRAGVDYIYSSPEVGNMVWRNIINTIGADVRNIYFSPSGLFYQWGVEYLMYHYGKRINETFVMHRVSSTKVLTMRKAPAKVTSAVLYGGIDYDIPVEVMLDVKNNKVIQTENELMDYDSQENMLALFESDKVACDTLAATRGSMDYLPGTAEEVDNIAQQFADTGIHVTLLKEEQATEESFKSLNGKELSVLHIATHGFALNEDNTNRQELVAILGASAGKRDMSMNYSGLLFAGANNALNRKPIPDELDNGILTAKEISVMDLRELDLVVLSACQTGLGEIKEDGVFGLQRGFKKAGAHTILMSLWSVDDRATQLMMTAFYKNLLEGYDKRKSFDMAQQHVRDAGFNAPYYWASFILLDDQ